MIAVLLALFYFTSITAAAWDGNLNYDSPSRLHPFLGINLQIVQKRGLEPRAWDPEKLLFTHGVASGDPYPDSVILWTRISPVVRNSPSAYSKICPSSIASFSSVDYANNKRSKMTDRM